MKRISFIMVYIMVFSASIFSQDPDYSEILGIPDDLLNRIMGVYIDQKFVESPYILLQDFYWGQSAFLPYDCYSIYPINKEDKYTLVFDDSGTGMYIEEIQSYDDLFILSVETVWGKKIITGIVYFKFLEDNMVHVWDGEFTGSMGFFGDQILFKLSGPGEPDYTAPRIQDTKSGRLKV